MVRIFIGIGLMFNLSGLFAQEFVLKKNSFSVFAANTTLLCRTPITGYSYGDQNGYYYQENYKIYNQTMKVNPGFGISCSRRLWKRDNAKHPSSSALFFTCDLVYSKIDYKRTKVGSYGGGIRSNGFDGTVKETFVSHFFSWGVGAKYYYTSVRGEIFGIAIGMDRNKIIASKTTQEYFNKLNGQSWTYSSGPGPRSQMTWEQRAKLNLTCPQDYFSFNLILSAGKNIGKSCHAGFYIQYSAPEYLFYSYSPNYETQNLSFTSNSRYLTYFNNITYGIYFSF